MMPLESIQIDHLPASVQELIDVVGMAAALVIVEERGGIRLCVPSTVNADHWLVPLIGMEALRALVNYYSREEIEIPLCAEALRAAREQQIHALAAAGTSNAELARQYGYTERGIRKLRRRVEGIRDDGQGDLF
ncbi:MAG: hypothetical protein OEX12_16110 [Gammaproteobacteria bacterium]|nr:hypothetical protein [Gammaproteobacteria bacterium]